MTKTEKRQKKARARRALGRAIAAGEGHNRIQQAARKAKISPAAARQLEKALK